MKAESYTRGLPSGHVNDMFGKPVIDSLRLSYARELRISVVQKAKTEEKHRRLTSGVRSLLDKEPVSPTILLKFLGDNLQPVKPQPLTDVDEGCGKVEDVKKVEGVRRQMVKDDDGGQVSRVNE